MFDIKEIKNPEFLVNLNIKQLECLCSDIRDFLLNKISQTGGHLSSNLGVVELTVGLYKVFDYKKDYILFDVGHQAYTHKILTGRADRFDTLRMLDGLSGYIDKDESEYDIWESGHSSSSIAASFGILETLKKEKKDSRVIVVIGDASLANGLSLEGLNILGTHQELNPIIIINDNKMGINESVGAIAKILNKKNKHVKNRVSKCDFKKKINHLLGKNNFFEELGFHYYGVYNGNNIKTVIDALEHVKNVKGPVIIHLYTQKGYGYQPSLEDNIKYHGLNKFDKETGKIIKKNDDLLPYDKIISDMLVNLKKDIDFSLINPAMIYSQYLEEFRNKYQDDIYDVGIAEEAGVVISSAMALFKRKVVVSLYSTFSQRAYDQILNDCSRQKLNVLFLIDRAGIIGGDGKTHQGIYDLSMFRSMPNIMIMMGKNSGEVKGLLRYGLNYSNGPIALRYQKQDVSDLEEIEIKDTSWVIEQKGKKAVIITYGSDVERVLKLGLDAYVINARFLRPLDKEMLKFIAKLNLPILVYEQVVESSSLLEAILAYYHKNDMQIAKLKAMNIDNNVVIGHGDVESLLEKYGLSDKDIIKSYEELIS